MLISEMSNFLILGGLAVAICATGWCLARISKLNRVLKQNDLTKISKDVDFLKEMVSIVAKNPSKARKILKEVQNQQEIE